jgi:hypothetical protein
MKVIDATVSVVNRPMPRFDLKLMSYTCLNYCDAFQCLQILSEFKCSPSCTRGLILGEPICPPDCFQYKGTLDVFLKVVRQVNQC